jgi:starch synthase
MPKERILFVCQEIYPFVPETSQSKIGRKLPQAIQESGYEIRTFMPRFGNINERRNQLHEVIRLSGMNLIINDNDHPLIIKVASIQLARLQIYFIDNEDFFQRKFMFLDKNNKFFKDNDERAIFYARGVIETVKKLGWSPELIHCHGWLSSLIPIYIKNAYIDNPLFTETKVIISLYDEDFTTTFNKNFPTKIKMEGISDNDLKSLKSLDYVSLMKLAIDFSDGVILASETINPELISYLKKSKKPVLSNKNELDYIKAYTDFYSEVLAEKPVLIQ